MLQKTTDLAKLEKVGFVAEVKAVKRQEAETARRAPGSKPVISEDDVKQEARLTELEGKLRGGADIEVDLGVSICDLNLCTLPYTPRGELS